MRKYGVKLWSTNILSTPDLIKDITKALKEGVFDFVELFAVPESYDKTSKALYNEFKSEKITIHAAHSSFGFDTGDKNKLKQNLKQFAEAQKFADLFNSEIIVTHGGMGNEKENIEETIRQFNLINDKRIAIENLPSYCSDTKVPLHGIRPDEIKFIKDEVGCMFCFDFSHAICAANSLKMDIFPKLEQYFDLNPSVYHVCDGNFNNDFDAHLHLGKGNYPLKALIDNYTSNNAMLTMETGGIPTSINPWVNDVNYLRNL